MFLLIKHIITYIPIIYVFYFDSFTAPMSDFSQWIPFNLIATSTPPRLQSEMKQYINWWLAKNNFISNRYLF